MTKSEYQELVEFLGKRFTHVDQRFTQIDQRFERVETELTRVAVGVEENRDRIRGVADGVLMVDEKLERLRAEVMGRLLP